MVWQYGQVLLVVLSMAACEMTEPEACGIYDRDYKILEKMAALQAKQNILEDKVFKQDEIIQTLKQGHELSPVTQETGTTYTRWGKQTCPGNGSELVYSGYMAGTHFATNTGSPGNYLCLPEEPIWGYYSETVNNNNKVTAVEYEFNPHQNVDLDQFFGSDNHRENAPCSVCHTTTRSAVVMIPGRNVCYPGWTLEYQGYLVTGYPGYADSTEYICLDRRPDSVPGSEKKTNSANYMYFVEASCSIGGLECPPYVQDRELSCAVCSK